jgi:hypothetical protein
LEKPPRLSDFARLGDMNVLCQPKGQRGLEIYDLDIVLLSKWLLKHVTTDGRSTWQQFYLIINILSRGRFIALVML